MVRFPHPRGPRAHLDIKTLYLTLACTIPPNNDGRHTQSRMRTRPPKTVHWAPMPIMVVPSSHLAVGVATSASSAALPTRGNSSFAARHHCLRMHAHTACWIFSSTSPLSAEEQLCSRRAPSSSNGTSQPGTLICCDTHAAEVSATSHASACSSRPVQVNVSSAAESNAGDKHRRMTRSVTQGAVKKRGCRYKPRAARVWAVHTGVGGKALPFPPPPRILRPRAR